MSRILSIDYGESRVGIATTDPLKIIASGYKTLNNDERLLESILEICRLKDIESIVIGIPFDNNSQIGISAKKVLLFAEKLMNYFNKNKFIIPFYEQDERYTTFDAYEVMKLNKIKNKKKKKIVDQVAAAKILSDFMSAVNKIKLDLSRYNYK